MDLYMEWLDSLDEMDAIRLSRGVKTMSNGTLFADDLKAFKVAAAKEIAEDEECFASIKDCPYDALQEGM